MTTLCMMMSLFLLVSPGTLKSEHHTDPRNGRRIEPKSPRVMLDLDGAGASFPSFTELPRPLVELKLDSASLPVRRIRSSPSLPTKDFGALQQSTMELTEDFPRVVSLPPKHEGDLLSIIFHNLLHYTFQHLFTIIVFHDESMAAQELIQNYLRSEAKRPVVVSSMTSRTFNPDTNITHTSTNLSTDPTDATTDLGNVPKTPDNIYAKKLQTKKYATITTVCIVVFEVYEVVESFFTSADPEWFPTNVALISLTGEEDLSPVFALMTTFRNVGVLKLSGSGRSKDVLQVVTHKPFAPKSKQLVTKTYNPYMVLEPSDLFPDRFDDFYNHHFRLASWIDDFPYLYYGKNKTVLGMGPTMLDEMARRLHFSYELFELSVDGFWGELVNGTWRGMIGELVRKEKDFVINGFVLVLDRSQAVDFSFPYITDSYTFVIKIPPPVPRWLAMVQPFGVNTWAALVASLCALAIAFHLLVYRDSSPIYSHKADVLSSVLWLLRAVLRQSVPVIPSSRGSRVFLLCWWLAALVISTSYMGNLIAFITVPAQAQRLRTLSQLAESDFRSNMLDYGNFVPGALKSSREPVLRELGNKLSLVDSYDEGIANMESGSHVLLEASAYIEYYMILQKQELVYFLEEKLYPGYVGWLFRKDTPWKYKVDQMLSWMAQTGLVSYWRRKNFEDFRRSQGLPAQRVEIQENLPRPLTLEDLQGAFLVFFLGLVAAAVVLMLEACLTKISDD